jgi:hypothetical protein
MFLDNVNIDDAFNEQLGNYEQSPPDEIWDSIEDTLKSNKKRSLVKYLQIAAFLALFLAVGALVVLQNYSFHQENLSNIVMKEKKPETVDKQKLNASEEESLTSNDLTIAGSSENNNEKKDKNRIIGNRKKEEDFSARKEEPDIHLTKLEPLFTGIDNKVPAKKQKDIRSNYQPDNKSPFNVEDENYSLLMAEKQVSPLELGGSFSPTVTYRTTTAKRNTASSINESSLITYSGGVNLAYKISDRLKLKSGVHYSQFGQSMDNINIDASALSNAKDNAVVFINGSIGTSELMVSEIHMEGKELYTTGGMNNNEPVAPGAPGGPAAPKPDEIRYGKFNLNNKLMQKMEFVKIPMLLEYKLIDKSFSLSMVSGLNTNILVSQGLYMENSPSADKVGYIRNLDQVAYSGTFGLGMDYQIDNNIQLTMQPLFDYFLNSFSSTTEKTFPYSFGLYTGLSVSF